MEAALRRRLGDHGIAGEQLHQLGVHEHAERIIPRCDVRHRPVEGHSVGELALDLCEIPLDTVEAAIDVVAREFPRLADFPHEQTRDGVALLSQQCHGLGDTAHALIQRHARPLEILLHRHRHRLVRGGGIDTGAPTMCEPSMASACGRVAPPATHSPPIRLRSDCASKASGAAARARAYQSDHAVPGFTCNGMFTR